MLQLNLFNDAPIAEAEERFYTRHEAPPNKDDYEAFIDKFKPKKTTDDCYTPPNLYDAISEWVANEYNLDRSDFVRPFYPGGDYERYKYAPDCVVVDNPPFSILASIVRFYDAHKIKFFLFAPTLTLFSGPIDACCSIGIGATITYENGAEVNTSFLTNLEAPGIRTAPALYQAIKAENDKNLKVNKKQLPKYEYPAQVITGARLAYLCKYGVDFRAGAEEIYRIDALQEQEAYGKTIFGYGFLMSDMATAKRIKAEEEAKRNATANVEGGPIRVATWHLLEREKHIINILNQGGAGNAKATR